jgi:hypothetical protein
MSVVRRREARADVQELPHPSLACQEANDTSQEMTVGTGDIHDSREDRTELVTGRAVDSVVVLAAQPVIPDPGRMRHRCVDPGPGNVIGLLRPGLGLGW